MINIGFINYIKGVNLRLFSGAIININWFGFRDKHCLLMKLLLKNLVKIVKHLCEVHLLELLEPQCTQCYLCLYILTSQGVNLNSRSYP